MGPIEGFATFAALYVPKHSIEAWYFSLINFLTLFDVRYVTYAHPVCCTKYIFFPELDILKFNLFSSR